MRDHLNLETARDYGDGVEVLVRAGVSVSVGFLGDSVKMYQVVRNQQTADQGDKNLHDKWNDVRVNLGKEPFERLE